MIADPPLMTIRLAVQSDASALAGIHYDCRDRLPASFMIALGRGFLTRYYQVLLGLKTTVVLCAEDGQRRVVGFASGTTDMERELAGLRAARFGLALAALPALAQRPRLAWQMLARSRGPKAAGANTFYVYQQGARAAFWGWAQGVAAGAGTIVLFKKWLEVMSVLEIPLVRGEVDLENTKIAAVHAAMGARVERHFSTPEGKKRILIAYDLRAPAKACRVQPAPPASS